jgi:hypothetical protein
MNRKLLDRVGLAAVAVALVACGGGPKPMPVDPTAGVPEVRVPGPAASEMARVGERSLQLYIVLTNAPDAMQGEAAVDAMWAAVRGEGPRYEAVRRHVKWAPSGYELDVTLDYADLPHPQVSPAQLEGMIATLPASAQARARGARLAVFVRSGTGVLPNGGHIRLAGLAALQAADQWNGVVLDAVARRGFTADAWHRALSAPSLGAEQGRLAARSDPDGGRWLLTRGNPKYGAPDLQMRRVPEAKLAAARARFIAAQQAIMAGAGAGATVPVPGGRVALGPCEAPPGMHDADCVEIPAP